MPSLFVVNSCCRLARPANSTITLHQNSNLCSALALRQESEPRTRGANSEARSARANDWCQHLTMPRRGTHTRWRVCSARPRHAIEKLQLIREVGRGAFGAVFLARYHGCDYAVK